MTSSACVKCYTTIYQHFSEGLGTSQGAIVGSLWRNNDDHLNANEGPSRLKNETVFKAPYIFIFYSPQGPCALGTLSLIHTRALRWLAAGASSDGQSCAARCLYLHHDGHAQRVFGDVFLAFLARSAPALGIFRFVQLVLLRLRHVADRRETDEWATRWLCRGTFLQPEDGEKQQQQTERSTSRETERRSPRARYTTSKRERRGREVSLRHGFRIRCDEWGGAHTNRMRRNHGGTHTNKTDKLSK